MIFGTFLNVIMAGNAACEQFYLTTFKGNGPPASIKEESSSLGTSNVEDPKVLRPLGAPFLPSWNASTQAMRRIGMASIGLAAVLATAILIVRCVRQLKSRHMTRRTQRSLAHAEDEGPQGACGGFDAPLTEERTTPSRKSRSSAKEALAKSEEALAKLSQVAQQLMQVCSAHDGANAATVVLLLASRELVASACYCDVTMFRFLRRSANLLLPLATFVKEANEDENGNEVLRRHLSFFEGVLRRYLDNIERFGMTASLSFTARLRRLDYLASAQAQLFEQVSSAFEDALSKKGSPMFQSSLQKAIKDVEERAFDRLQELVRDLTIKHFVATYRLWRRARATEAPASVELSKQTRGRLHAGHSKQRRVKADRRGRSFVDRSSGEDTYSILKQGGTTQDSSAKAAESTLDVGQSDLTPESELFTAPLLSTEGHLSLGSSVVRGGLTDPETFASHFVDPYEAPSSRWPLQEHLHPQNPLTSTAQLTGRPNTHAGSPEQYPAYALFPPSSSHEELSDADSHSVEPPHPPPGSPISPPSKQEEGYLRFYPFYGVPLGFPGVESPVDPPLLSPLAKEILEQLPPIPPS